MAKGREGCVDSSEVFVDAVSTFLRVVSQFTDVVQEIFLFGTKYSLHVVEPVARFSVVYALHLCRMVVLLGFLDFECYFLGQLFS